MGSVAGCDWFYAPEIVGIVSVGIVFVAYKQGRDEPNDDDNRIADKIAAEQNLTKVQAKAIVESVFKEFSEAARSGGDQHPRLRQGHAGPRGPQSFDRRNDQDRGLQEALLHTGKSRQGRA